MAALLALYLVPWALDVVRLRMTIEILYFGLFAVSFNLLFGYAGLLSFGHAATFGIGGYTVGLALKHIAGLPLLAALGVGALAGALGGLVIGFFCVRLRGTYFALLTLAFSQFLYAVALKWRGVTRGDDGLTVSVPDITLPGVGVLRMGQPAHFYWRLSPWSCSASGWPGASRGRPSATRCSSCVRTTSVRRSSATAR